MNVTIHECKRENLCVDCYDGKCWHKGQLIADCPLYYCNRDGDSYEDCESCDLLKRIHEEWRGSASEGIHHKS